MVTEQFMPQMEEDLPSQGFQQDGAPPRFHLDVHQYLKDTLPKCWIGYVGKNYSPVLLWPPGILRYNILKRLSLGTSRTWCMSHPCHRTWDEESKRQWSQYLWTSWHESGQNWGTVSTSVVSTAGLALKICSAEVKHGQLMCIFMWIQLC